MHESMLDDLPLYDVRDAQCPLCAASSPPGVCDNCRRGVGDILNMFGNGYRSPKPVHAHLTGLLGASVKEGAFSELCLDCYREAWKLAYPNHPCQV